MSRTPKAPQAGSGDARIIEVHDFAGPHREDEIEATDDRGRHWYRLLPKPRRRTDLWGFNSTWWMALLGHRDPPGDFSVPPVVT